MATKISAEAYRQGCEAYANQEITKIHTMSSADREKSISQLRNACLSSNPGLPSREIASLMQYSGGMTEDELRLRAAFQTKFEALSPEELQSHFTHFYQKGRIITRLIEAGNGDNNGRQLDCRKKANSLLVDELGKTLLRKGSQPQVPSDPMQKA